MRQMLAEIQGRTDTASLWALVRGYFNARGIDKISYHHFVGHPNERQGLTVSTDGFDDRWVCHYMDNKLFLVDPITDLARSATRPFFWSEIENLMKTSKEQRAYLADMRDAHLGDGLAFQVFGPGLRNGYVGLGFVDPKHPPGQDDIIEMQYVAQAGHLRYCELNPIGAGHGGLSPRERQILRWIARGKSNSVIADILSLSPHTVDTLVRRIFDKLSVSDRTTAAIQGVGSGLILP